MKTNRCNLTTVIENAPLLTKIPRPENIQVDLLSLSQAVRLFARLFLLLMNFKGRKAVNEALCSTVPYIAY